MLAPSSLRLANTSTNVGVDTQTFVDSAAAFAASALDAMIGAVRAVSAFVRDTIACLVDCMTELFAPASSTATSTTTSTTTSSTSTTTTSTATASPATASVAASTVSDAAASTVPTTTTTTAETVSALVHATADATSDCVAIASAHATLEPSASVVVSTATTADATTTTVESTNKNESETDLTTATAPSGTDPIAPCVHCGTPTDFRCEGCYRLFVCSVACMTVVWASHEDDCRVVLKARKQRKRQERQQRKLQKQKQKEQQLLQQQQYQQQYHQHHQHLHQQASSSMYNAWICKFQSQWAPPYVAKPAREYERVPTVPNMTITTVVKTTCAAPPTTYLGSHTVVLLGTSLHMSAKRDAKLRNARDFLHHLGVAFTELDATTASLDILDRLDAISGKAGKFPRLFVVEQPSTPLTPTLTPMGVTLAIEPSATHFSYRQLASMHHFDEFAVRPPTQALVHRQRMDKTQTNA